MSNGTLYNNIYICAASMVTANYMLPLNTWSMVSVTEKPRFQFDLILIN